jgi:hypothetical protein
MLQSSIVLACLLSCVGAQTPTMAPSMSPSLCDKYVTALTGTNNKANQEIVLRLVVNTAVAGNIDFTSPFDKSSMQLPKLTSMQMLLLEELARQP